MRLLCSATAAPTTSHTVVASARGEASSVCGVGGLHTLPVVEDGACMPWASTPVMCKRSPRSSLRKKKVRCLSPTCTVAYISLPSLMLRLLRGYWRHCRLRHDGRQWWGLRIRLWKILKAVAASKGLLLVCSLLPSAVRTRQSARQRPLPLLVLFRALPTGILELSRDRRAKCGLTETISLSFDGEKESPFFLCGMLGRIVAAAFYLSYYRMK